MPLHLIQFVALLLLLLVTGVFWGPWFALHRSLQVFSGDEFLKIVNTIAKNLALPMRILMPACILVLLLAVVFGPHGGIPFFAHLAAFVLLLLALIITLAVEVPIIGRISQWTPETIPSDWELVRDRWVRFHVVRMLAAIAAFASFTLASLAV